MSAHTKGPWTFKRKYANGTGAILGPDGRGVAAISGAITRPTEENAANGAMLTAAPVLYTELEACTALLRGIEHAGDYRVFARQVRERIEACDAALTAAVKVQS